MSILGINCSPRINRIGQTSASNSMLEQFMESVKFYGGEGKIINMVDLNIYTCEGCYSDNVITGDKCTYPCIHEDDDTAFLLNEIVNADALVIASPCYWGSLSSLFHVLKEKMTAIENDQWKMYEKTGTIPLLGIPLVLLVSEAYEGASLACAEAVWASKKKEKQKMCEHNFIPIVTRHTVVDYNHSLPSEEYDVVIEMACSKCLMAIMIERVNTSRNVYRTDANKVKYKILAPENALDNEAHVVPMEKPKEQENA